MLSMGESPHTTLELARKKALDARALLAQNIEPSTDRVEKATQAKGTLDKGRRANNINQHQACSGD